ncbi:Predicted Zn-dependent peptidase [Nitratiruptor tergarcus DSM 16512]|uniref:Predicted Zn-dependent peptidase n=2 Tax=Nitratiruptor tergarcus TaxID=269259 RepID=A0A1W1WV00_9BACT|nr:Predicted Zn-dependent peptidase [Nitratiruptor tergarcus DSM 16512]
MRFVFLLILLVQGVLMSAELKHIEIKGVKIPVIYEKDTNLPIAGLQIVFQKSGSIEDGELPGLAKMSAKMLSQGTKSLGNVGFAKKLEERAVRFSVTTGVETMVMEVSSLKEELKNAIELVKKIFVEPNLTPKALEQVKTTTLGYLSRKKKDYDYIASINLKKILFAGTPLQNPSDGTQESIQKISLQNIEEFLQKHLVLKRAIVVVGGDLEFSEAKKLIQELLEPLAVGKSEPLPFYEASSKQQEIVQKEKETKQAYIYFGSPYNERVTSDDLHLSRLAMFILGTGGFGSRLMEEIRVKRGLAYSAYSMARINKSHSYFTGYLQTKLESADEAKKLVKEVIADFVAKGATQKELESAKKFLLGSEPLRNETLSQRLSRAFHEFYTGKPLGYSKEELKKIEKVTLSELNDFIKKHSEIEKLSFSIVTQ